MKALVERLHTDHGVRLGAGMKVTFAASADLFDIRAAARVTTGEHPGARKLLAWTIPHLTSARDGMGTRAPVIWLARSRQTDAHLPIPFHGSCLPLSGCIRLTLVRQSIHCPT